jgi:hypothetical protein
MFKNEKEEL